MEQLNVLFEKTEDTFARISTTTAILHNKFDYYFWTGYYRIIEGELTVTSYQGSVACLVLAKDVGVCWTAINQGKSIIVEDVEKFPNHIACDSKSKSEIVIPIRDKSGNIVGVFDVDSKELNSFDEIDRIFLEKIVNKFYM